MNRDRVMRFRINAILREEFDQLIPLFRPLSLDYVEMKNMAIAWLLRGKSKMLRSFESRGVTSSPFSAQIIPGIDMSELRAEYPRMKIIQSAVETVAMDIALGRSMIAQFSHR